MAKQTITKCSFCRYWTGSGCMTTPNPINCREATVEYYQNLRTEKPQKPVRSLRKWEKR